MLSKLRSYAKQQYFSVWYAVILSPILFTYFILSNGGVTPGLQIDGAIPKLTFKATSILLLMFVMGGSFRRGSKRDVFCWIALGLPILSFAVLSLFSGERFYLQAINAALFLPILAISWYRKEARFRIFFGTISRIMAIQVLMSLIFSEQVLSSWDNRAMTGGLGNPNSFSLFCMASFFWFSMVERKFIYALIAIIGVFMSGSLTALIAFVVASVFAFNIWRNIGLIISVGVFIPFYLDMFPESATRALAHALAKLCSLYDYIVYDITDVSASVSYRAKYLREGLDQMSDDSLSWFWGHPNGLIMYTGDGYFTAIMVTHGFIALSLFVLYFFMLFSCNGVGDHRLFRFSKILLVCIFIYLMANRIVDYYPAALLLMLSVGYIVSFYSPSTRASTSSSMKPALREGLM